MLDLYETWVNQKIISYRGTKIKLSNAEKATTSKENLPDTLIYALVKVNSFRGVK